MSREIVKLRKVSGSIVITIPTSILTDTDFNDGDRVMIQPMGADKLSIIKEKEHNLDIDKEIQKIKLEINTFNKEKDVLETESELWIKKWNSGYIESGIDGDLMDVGQTDLQLKILKIESSIAKKKQELFELENLIKK